MIVLYGQPGTGKTTLARRLAGFIVDGDLLRAALPNPGYDRDGREENIRRAWLISTYAHHAGFPTTVALVNPYRRLRDEYWPSAFKVLLTVDEPRRGFQVDDFEPEGYDLHVDTGRVDVDEAVRLIRRTVPDVP